MGESGSLKQVGPKPEDIGTVSKGSYSYTSPDGVVLTVNWVADENGFQATGDRLSIPPPIPMRMLHRLLPGADNAADIVAKFGYSLLTAPSRPASAFASAQYVAAPAYTSYIQAAPQVQQYVHAFPVVVRTFRLFH